MAQEWSSAGECISLAQLILLSQTTILQTKNNKLAGGMHMEPVNIQNLIKNQNQSNNISQVPCNSSKRVI